MKFKVLFVVSLVVLAAVEGSIFPECAKKTSSSHHRAPKQIEQLTDTLKSLARKNINITTEESLIELFSNSSSSQTFLMSNNSTNTTLVNYKSIGEHYMSAVSVLREFFDTTRLGALKPHLRAETNATLTYLGKLTLDVNQTELNHLIGALYLTDKIEFVRGTTGSQTIEFAEMQNDSRAACVLDLFVQDGIERETRALKQQLGLSQGIVYQIYSLFGLEQ